MLFSDIRYALRGLRKSPAFTFAAVATLALGIGANTAIFSVVNAEMLRLVPYPDPGRLVWVAERNDKLHLATWSASLLNYLSWKEQSQSFDQLGAIGYTVYNLTGQGDPELVTGCTLTPSIFPLLGIQPTRGRAFQEREDQPGSPAVAMIGENLWKRRFAADPAVIGRTIQLNDVPTMIVGVAPASLALVAAGDIWTPQTVDRAQEIRLNHRLSAVGRLKRGVSVPQAQAEMDLVSRNVGQQYPEVRDWGTRLVTFDRWLAPDELRSTLWMLMGAVVLVLLIACANVANLLLARGTSRRREVAIRMAMGANRGRLLRQFLTESAVLSSLGGAAGCLGALWLLSALHAALPEGVLPVPRIEIDATVMLFALGVTFVTGLVFGIAPAWGAATTELSSVLKQTGRSSVGAGRHLLRRGLAAAELALAVMLLVGAGLLVQSFLRLQKVRTGFQEQNLLTFHVALPATQFGSADRAWAFWRRMLDSFATLPGIRAAGISSGIPFGNGVYGQTPVTTVGKTALPPDMSLPADWRVVSPGYFRAMGIPLLSGRDLTDHDGANAPQVAIVTRETAQQLWGEDDPLGRMVHIVGSGKDFTVVGVVGSSLNTTLNRGLVPAMYFSAAARLSLSMDVVVRTEGEPQAALTAVRQRLRDLDAELPITYVHTMEEWIAISAAQPRLNAILLAGFSGAALLIAAIGVYGVLSYSVSQRTREIGLRMALGARRENVLTLIVREGMAVALIGIVAGLLGALALSRALTSLVYGIPVRDPTTFGSAALLLVLIAAASCYMPARRASMVDPMVALREE
jgi:putative ABC transport system permease protein